MSFPEIAGAIRTTNADSPLVITGFAMMLVGVGFKLALVPFHMWTPDVYQGAPAPVSGYIATVSKGGLMAVFIRFFFYVKGYSNQEFFIVISAIAVLSMFVGNLLAIRQRNLKRLLGYSSIANMGYLLIILLVGTKQGAQAAIFYLISYFVTVVGAFGVISLLSTSTKEAERIEDYRGLFWKRPWLAIVLTLSLLSLAGIPITAGFIAKFYVIFEGVKSGLMLLVFAMIISSIIGLYYYIRVIAALFSTGEEIELPSTSFIGKVALTIITVGILVLGLYPGWLIGMITKLVVL
jgi:NADH-quinone oxidoreductase subunit N